MGTDNEKNMGNDGEVNGDYQLFGGSSSSGEESSVLDDCCPEWTWSQRITGWLVCFGIGLVFNFCAFIGLWSGNGTTFGILYIIGELFAFGGSFFLNQPADFIRSICRDADRVIATSVWFGTMAIILVI